jgi:uncharacterized protein YukE
MTSYQPLTGDDPFVGDAGALQDYASALRLTGSAAADVATTVKNVASASEATWVGDAAQGFRACAAEAAAPLSDLAERLEKTANAVDEHAETLYLAQIGGQDMAGRANDVSVTRRWIQQQLNAAMQTADPFAVSNLRLQLADQEHEFAGLRRQFHQLQADFEESADKTRQKLFKLWSLNSRFDLSGKSGELIEKPKPKLHNAPDLGDGRDVRNGTTNSGKRVHEVIGRSPGLLGKGNGATRTVTTTTEGGPGFAGLPERGYSKKINYSSDGKIPPDHPGKSAAKKVAGSTKATVASASSKASSFQGAKANKQGKNFGGQASVGAAEKAQANASVSAGKDGLKATAGAGASAKLEAKAGGSVTSKYVNGDASVHASVGAEAEGKATLGIGKDGVNAGIEVKASLGGEIGADANIDIGGIGAGGHAGVTYGIGAELNVKANVSLDKVSVKADLGATLGLGGHVSVDINIHPKEIAHNIADFFGF